MKPLPTIEAEPVQGLVSLSTSVRNDEPETGGPNEVVDRLAAWQRRVMDHPVYRAVDRRSLPCFMEHHVFAVLDFMWLLKSLQVSLTSTEIAWIPVGEPTIRRFINEIVLGEESDAVGERYVSHFDLYVEAMEEVGADPTPVLNCVDDMRRGAPVTDALESCGGPPAAIDFSLTTWDMASTGELHERAAAFAFGREEIIPEMFSRLLGEDGALGECQAFRTYLERHIELDGDLHGPMALQLVQGACGDDPERWAGAQDAAAKALNNRTGLWDAVVAQAGTKSNGSEPARA